MQTVLTPLANGTELEWDDGTGTGFGEVDGDNDLTYWATFHLYCQHTCYVDALKAASISRVQHFIRMWAENCPCYHYRRIDGVATTGCGVPHAPPEAWTNYTWDSLARPGGGNLTPADFKGSVAGSIEFGVNGGDADPDRIWCSRLYVTVDYTPGGSCFYTELGSWIPPLITLGAGLLNREIWGVLKTIQVAHLPRSIGESIAGRREGRKQVMPIPTLKEEFEAIRIALAVRPRFCFLGELMGT